MEITEDTLKTLPFESFRKSALLRARPLTEEDCKQRNGTIQTLEGPATFRPGDYLAQGIQNEEWPITQERFGTIYQRVSEPDAEGFARYRSTELRQAYRMPEPFAVRRANGDILRGKGGDYLLRSDTRVWVVDYDIFERTYERVP